MRGGFQVALGQIVGLGEHDDVHATVGGKWVDLNSTLASGGITPDCCAYTFLPPWINKGKERSNKRPLGRDPPAAPSNVPPTVSEKEPRIVPPRGTPGAGVKPSPTVHDGETPCEDMIKALKLLQSVMSAEDFSKYEKMVLPPPKKEERAKLREQELIEKVQKQKGLEKQEQSHLEQIKEQEHNLKQQRLMLEDVQSRLEAVRDEVKALNVINLDTAATPLDIDTDIKDEEVDEWQTVLPRMKKKKVLMKLKGTPPAGRKERFKGGIVDGDMSGKEIARALAKLSRGGMREFVPTCTRMLWKASSVMRPT